MSSWFLSEFMALMIIKYVIGKTTVDSDAKHNIKTKGLEFITDYI